MKKIKSPIPSDVSQKAECHQGSAILGKLLLSPITHLFLIVIVGAAIYANTFGVPFILDDVTSIYGNPVVRSFKLAFRPRMIGDLSFALNYHLGGMAVAGYHLVNLLIHVLNGLLVYGLLSLLLKTPFFASADRERSDDRLVALFTALLFICHPIQTQAVTYISQRVASLATLFYLGTLVSWLAARNASTRGSRIALYGISVTSALLAMATKEIAFTLPITILLMESVFFGGSMRRLAVPAALFSFTAVLVPAAFFAAYGSNGGILESLRRLATPTNVISRADYFLTQLRVQVTYLRLLFFPKGQNLDYDYPVFHSLFSLPVAASLILILALIFCAFCLLAQARKKGPPDLLLAGFGILWFFVTLSVESTLIPLQDVIFEHRIYLPSVGFFAAFVTILFAAKRDMSDRKIAAAGIVIPFLAMIVLLSAAAAAARNEVWRDEVTLWQDVVVNSPAKARAHGSLGSAYQKRGRYDEAALEYETAIKLDQKDAASYNNLGTVYQLGQKWEDAASMYRKAVVLDPKNVKARYNLGTVLTKLGRYNEAEAELREAVRLKPDYDAAHNALGIVYARLTRNGDALAEFGKAARLNPGNSEAVSNFQALNNAMNGEPRLNK